MLLAWECFATRLAVGLRPLGKSQGLIFDNTKTERLHESLDQIPRRNGSTDLRVLTLGCSQLRLIPDQPGLTFEGPASGSMPVLLGEHLSKVAPGARVFDFSTPGQSLAESALVGVTATPVIAPDIVVIDIALHAAQRPQLRPLLVRTLRETPDLLAHLPATANLPKTIDRQLKSDSLAQPEAVESTVQERLDDILTGWLSRVSVACRIRRDLHKHLLQGPIKRRVVPAARSALGLTRRAWTYRLGEDFGELIEALEWGVGEMTSRGSRVLLVAFPFDSKSPTPPYLPEEHSQLLEATRALEDVEGVEFIDLSGLLDSTHFRSGDGLHYLPSGHQILARRLLCEVVQRSGPPSRAGAESSRSPTPCTGQESPVGSDALQ